MNTIKKALEELFTSKTVLFGLIVLFLGALSIVAFNLVEPLLAAFAPGLKERLDLSGYWQRVMDFLGWARDVFMIVAGRNVISDGVPRVLSVIRNGNGSQQPPPPPPDSTPAPPPGPYPTPRA